MICGLRTPQLPQNVNLESSLLFEETKELYKKTSVSPQLCELRNIITVAYLIVKSAQFRHESRGLHYTTEFPQHHSQA